MDRPGIGGKTFNVTANKKDFLMIFTEVRYRMIMEQNKLLFTPEEAESLMNMLNSADQESEDLAVSIIDKRVHEDQMLRVLSTKVDTNTAQYQILWEKHEKW